MKNHKRQHCEMDEDNNSTTDGTVEDGNELLKELQWKLAVSESKNALLEAKLENQELKAQILVLTEENKRLLKLPNGEGADERSENKITHQKMQEFGKEMAIMKEQLKEAINSFQTKIDILWDHVKKTKIVRNPKANRWEATNMDVTISEDGVNATTDVTYLTNELNVYAEKGFAISGKNSRMGGHIPGIIIYYFEVTQKSFRNMLIGLSDGKIPDDSMVGQCANSYAVGNGDDYYRVAGKDYDFEWPMGAVKPTWKNDIDDDDIGDVVGCGILMNQQQNDVAIFFTGNGILMGKQIPIICSANCLYPTVTMCGHESLEANFGDDLDNKPFKYDIVKCPGLDFE